MILLTAFFLFNLSHCVIQLSKNVQVVFCFPNQKNSELTRTGHCTSNIEKNPLTDGILQIRSPRWTACH